MIIRRNNIIPDVLILEPEILQDDRGRFVEDFRISDLMDHVDSFAGFKQGNTSYSLPGVLRGIHFQTRHPQGKLIRCVIGRIQQVCVDLREGSPYFSKHVATLLDDITCRLVYCPVGFGNAFLVPGNGLGATVSYQCTDYYLQEYEQSLVWNDPNLDIKWLTQGRNPILSRKDRAGLKLGNIEPIRV